MPVNAVTNAFSNYAQKVVGGSSGGSTPPSTSAALQEAMETKAQTAKEARNGDRVAIRKLQRIEQQNQQAQDESSTSAPDKGIAIDQKA
jgi:hypothetical protein